MGQYYSILRTAVNLQLVQNALDADTDGDAVEYEVRTPTSTTTYAHKSSALRAWRRIAAEQS